MNYRLSLSSWNEKEINAIHRVIESGWYSMGSEVAAYETEFAEKMGSTYAVAVNSGSSANLLAIAALTFKKDNPLRPGDEVIVPALSWSTMFNPVSQYGMKLVFIDIDIDDLNMDVRLLNGALSKKTKAVFVPHILGCPARIHEIQEFCDNNNLYFIEDNCESMGAVMSFKHTGTFGICGTFSTFFCHHISTMEGGVILTDDQEIYHILLALRAHGWTRELPFDNTLVKKKRDDFYESFRFVLPGYNVRPTEMSAAIGREQLKKLDAILQVRRENAEYFNSLFKNRFMLQREYGESSWFAFSMITSYYSTLKRPTIIKALQKAGIETRPILSGNFLRSKAAEYLDYRIGCDNLWVVDRVHETGFCVGNHPIDMREQIDYLYNVLNNLDDI